MKNKAFAEEYKALEEEFELAREIIKLRTKAKLTQSELAKRAGTSQPAIARLESGTYRNLTLSFLRRIGEVLGAYPEIKMKRVA
jgi:predicted transcriptional regulator